MSNKSLSNGVAEKGCDMKNDWDFYDLVLTGTREERERAIDEMSEEEAKEKLKQALRAMFRAKDEQEDQKK